MKTFGIRTLLVVTAIVAGVCGLIFPALRAAQNAEMEMSCRNNIKCIGLALLNYESTYQRLPMAVETSKDGKLWRSWRSHVYPSFIEQSPPIYDETSAWDSSTNARLLNGTPISVPARKGGGKAIITLDRVPWPFHCPKCEHTNGVNYVVITGMGTAFPKSGSTKFSDFTDGLENTLLVVESINCTPDWTEPRDLDVESMDFTINSLKGPSISSSHPSGAIVCFADLAVYIITPRVSEAELRALISISGGEELKRDDLVARGVLLQR